MLHLLDVTDVGADRGEERGEVRAAAEALLVVLDGGPLDPQDVAVGFLDAVGELVSEALGGEVQPLGRSRVGLLEVDSTFGFGDAVADVFHDHVDPP